MLPMYRALGTAFFALLGLAFGSFLNVCATRWPEEESVVRPGSHCRGCGRKLTWPENIPLASWIALRGRCRACNAWIGLRYPLAEFALGFTWAVIAWQAASELAADGLTKTTLFDISFFAVQKAILCWLLVLLAVLDAEHLWLPDRFTLGGAVLGLPFVFVRFGVHWVWRPSPIDLESELAMHRAHVYHSVLHWIVGIILAPALILFVRWAYKLVRHREGIGLGDAKLMLLLAVWLGLAHTMLAFVLGVVLGTLFAFVLLVIPAFRRDATSWLTSKLPLGTFLCVGGIVSALWGRPIIAWYLRASGF